LATPTEKRKQKEMMNATDVTRAELRRQIDGFLAKEKLTATEKTQCNLLMSKLADLRSDDERRAKAAQVAKEMGIPYNVTAPTEKDAELEAFKRYMAYGQQETRTYTPMSDAVQGAYVVPQIFYNKLLTGVAQFTELMDRNNVTLLETEKGNTMTLPAIDLSTITSAQVLENVDAPPVANPTISSSVLKAYTYRTNPIAASFELEQDSFESITDILTAAFSTGLARGIGSDLVNGSGSGAPTGILTAAANSGVTSTLSTNFSAGELEQVYLSVNRGYRVSPKAAWLMNDSTYSQVLRLVDGNARPLVKITEDGETLYGKRIHISPDMPTAAASKAVLFGDLSQFYVRILRNSVSVRRNVEYPGYAERGSALYTGFMRVDSALNNVGGTKPVVYGTLHA
jgi:HK97 family phage major capsid protein